MKSKLVIILIGFILLVNSARAQQQQQQQEAASPAPASDEQQTWRGLLVDARYAADLLSYESVAQKAKKYSKELGLKAEAQKSGYGVVVRDKFYAFDVKGNELALDLLRRTTKTARLDVEVSGTLLRGNSGGAVVESTGVSPKPGTPSRDRLGRPTYDPVPGQTTERTYGTSATLGRRRNSPEKILVESIKEVEPPATSARPADNKAP